MKNYTKSQDVSLLVLRLVVAAIFLVAGYYKLPFWSGPVEGVSAGMAIIMKLLSIVEPLGALALIIGFLTRLASGGLAIIMIGAIFVLKFGMGAGFITSSGAGWNFPLVILAGCIILITFGAGKWSVDNRKFLKKNAEQL